MAISLRKLHVSLNLFLNAALLHAYPHRGLKNLRCIVFVQRVITAIVLCRLVNVLLPSLSGWKTEYTAGSNTCFSLQSMMVQNKIVEEFRTGTVNVIVATSVLEEGLHVQSCNLVVRFDTSATVCSFIQSRGRARMQNSEFLLLVKVATILHLRD